MDDKALRTKEVSSQERDLLLHKTSIPETIPEKKDVKSFIITTPTEGKGSSVMTSREEIIDFVTNQTEKY